MLAVRAVLWDRVWS